MDFWNEDAVGYNWLCLYPDPSQNIPGAGACESYANVDDGKSCLSATDILSGRAPEADNFNPVRTRGAGCKNDSGPLWVTVQLVDEENGIGGANGGGDVPRTVWARIF